MNAAPYLLKLAVTNFGAWVALGHFPPWKECFAHHSPNPLQKAGSKREESASHHSAFLNSIVAACCDRTPVHGSLAKNKRKDAEPTLIAQRGQWVSRTPVRVPPQRSNKAQFGSGGGYEFLGTITPGRRSLGPKSLQLQD